VFSERHTPLACPAGPAVQLLLDLRERFLITSSNISVLISNFSTTAAGLLIDFRTTTAFRRLTVQLGLRDFIFDPILFL
jgi:hypothetical protein